MRRRRPSPRGLLRRLGTNERGNVLILFGFAIVPMVMAVGMGIDYARAMRSQTRLNAVSDAAALVAVSKSVLAAPDSIAVSYANLMFSNQSQGVLASGVILDSLTISAPTDSSTGRRTALVTYAARSPNLFGQFFGIRYLTLKGTSQTTNATAPNIDFYMLLDVSASMALPVTSAGLTKVAASNGSSCQFACHATNDLKGTDANGNTVDLYAVAKSYNLTLRIDDEGVAVSKLTSDAQSTQSKNGATYRMAISTFRGDGGFQTIQTLTSNLATAATKTTSLTPFNYYSNGCPTSTCSSSAVGWNDQDTGSSEAFTNMNTLMPTPGTGIGGANPQQIMFVITDGMRDEQRPGGRPEVAFDTTKCDTIKARGIRIAILYTEYLAQSLANDSWSQSNVAPYLSQVEPALQACASPGLYTKVTTNQDIYTALDGLFQNAVATARISK